jgi:hypothetical protein
MKFFYILLLIIVYIIYLIINNKWNLHKNINLYQIYHDKNLIPSKVYDNIKKYAPKYKHIVFNFEECQKFIKK